MNILAQLLNDVRIRRIYAVSRKPKGISLMEKIMVAFATAGLDETALKSSKVVLLSADLALPDLGIEPGILEEVSAFWSAKMAKANNLRRLR